MKKLAAISLCAFCAFATGLNAQEGNAQASGAEAPAAAGSADVAALQKKVAELEKLLEEADKAMYKLLAKDMNIISKLRAENRALKEKIEALTAQLGAKATGQATGQAAKNSISEWKSPQQQYSDIKAEGAKVRKDAAAIDAEYEEIHRKAEAAEEARKSKNSDEEKKEEKGSSFWDHAFPF